MMKRSYPESVVHKSVAEYLRLVLYPQTWWTSIAHGNRGKPVRGALWKAQGAKPGVPDVIIISNGIAYFIEIKSEAGQLSPAQKECHEAIRSAGAHVATCRSIDDIAENLAQWCIETREKRQAA